jgi:agmatine deiminase
MSMPSTNEQVTQTPAAAGFRLPAEWEPHEATWIAWPHNPTDFPGKLPAIHLVYGEIARKLAESEAVRIIVTDAAQEASAKRILTRAHADISRVEFFHWKTDRSWARDFGPICVRRSATADTPAQVAVANFKFTAWGHKYPNWKLDNQIPDRVSRALKLPKFDVKIGGEPFALEGGGIDVNGRGTIITTEECFLHPDIQVRNPGATRETYEGVFRDYLGAANVLWLGEGIVGDDTHGHVDDLCRFVAPDTAVTICQNNPEDANYRALAANRERLGGMKLENGGKLNVVELPCPGPLYYAGERLPASYANFYIANSTVLVPTFNDPADRQALGILADLFPHRKVMGIHAVDLALGYGTIHCLTQQQPAR